MIKLIRFSPLEMLGALLFLVAIGSIFYSQDTALRTFHRDEARRTAINAIHYNLKEVVQPALKGYPSTLNEKQLSSMNSDHLRDPNGVMINQLGSDYHYEPTGCNGGVLCSGYTLRADLEREVDFIKTEDD